MGLHLIRVQTAAGDGGAEGYECEDYPKYPFGKTASITLELGKDVLHLSFFKSMNYKGARQVRRERS
jgi:hypothetical protein